MQLGKRFSGRRKRTGVRPVANFRRALDRENDNQPGASPYPVILNVQAVQRCLPGW
jgi:hypothetical protein